MCSIAAGLLGTALVCRQGFPVFLKIKPDSQRASAPDRSIAARPVLSFVSRRKFTVTHPSYHIVIIE